MSVRIKNWSKHQHFKDRTPPWIKLYRDILDDPDWHELSGDDAKMLVNLWLIASEDETRSGELPNARRLAFRLRIKESQVNQALARLSHWLIQDDINVISTCHQVDAPEESRGETEQNRTARADLFNSFWKAYPKKTAIDAARKAFDKRKPDAEMLSQMLQALETQSASPAWTKDGGQFIPNPATWLNGGRWQDGPVQDFSYSVQNNILAGAI